MAHALPDLPYSNDALAPHISAETLGFHHGKHHAGYVKKLNAALEGTGQEDTPLVELLNNLDRVSPEKRVGVFNCGAQHFNHSFYWNCMAPNAGGLPTGALASAIEHSFGSFDAFKAAFTKASVGHFGSGWGWLVKDASGTLSITSTHDADTPVAHDLTPLLTCDVWEHAYYVDYRNARAQYVENFWNLVNWDFVASNL
jgi:Fe-Mn family superoxide dismutase